MSTMRCEAAREQLLGEEPQQLEAALGLRAPAAAGSAGGELRAHLEACADCALLVRAILAENAALADGLARLTARRGGGAARPDPVAHPAGTAARRARRPPRWLAASTVLAAAATLVLLLWPQVADRSRTLTQLPGPALDVPATPVVNAAGTGGVAVMRTNDPHITVVWTF